MTLAKPVRVAMQTRRTLAPRPAIAHGVRRGALCLAQALLTICLAVALCLPLALRAAPYGKHDLRQLLIPAAGGGAGGTFSMRYLEAILDDIALHAGNYPPQFDSAQDRARAQQDVANLMGMLDAAFGSKPVQPAILLGMGRLGAAGHNLDMPKAADYAASRLARLLAIDPQHAMGNYHFGQFLAGTGRLKESEPYLAKAREKGVIGASYALGMVHLGHGDQHKALMYLGEYQKAVPSDARIAELVRAIREGKVEVRRMGANQ